MYFLNIIAFLSLVIIVSLCSSYSLDSKCRYSIVCDDWYFSDEHRTLVEPACGATLAAGYSGIVKKLNEENKLPTKGPIVFVVCGGNIVTTDMLLSWKKDVNI